MQSQESKNARAKVKTPDLAREKNTLTVTLHIGGKQIEELTDEQCERMAQRLSETMNRYYGLHPEEYANIRSN